jgi:hypothetical protein
MLIWHIVVPVNRLFRGCKSARISMGFSGIVVLAAPKLYHEKPLSINLFGEGIVV